MFYRLNTLLASVATKICSIGLFLCFIVACTQPSKDTYQGYVDGDFTFIAPQFSGIIEKLAVREGETVKKGDLLFQLESEPQLSRLKQVQFQLQAEKDKLRDFIKGQRETIIEGIQAQISKTRAELTLNKIQLKRKKSLFEAKAGSKEEYDIAKTRYDLKLEEIEQLKANLEEAKLGRREDIIAAQKKQIARLEAQVNEFTWILNEKRIYAPTNALIYDRFFQLGEFVPAARPVLSLLDPKHIYLIFFIPLTKISEIQAGDTITINCQGCKKTYSAKIFFISPKVEFTPPVIYTRERNEKYVYRVKASPQPDEATEFHLGQPIQVKLKVPNHVPR